MAGLRIDLRSVTSQADQASREQETFLGSILNTDATALNLWKLALQSSSCLSLFRDEVFHIHKAAEDLFVNIRGYGIFTYSVLFGESSEWIIY